MLPGPVTHSQLILGITLIFAVATLCQLVAPKLRLPALVLLLPAGFLLGIWVPGANPLAILGDSFGPIVDLVVAIILYQGGMDLASRKIDRDDRRTVWGLVFVGGAITWACATALMWGVIGMPFDIALLAGAIVIVSGPTVVNPLLSYVRPKTRIRNVLLWESTFLDPVGALTAVIVFQAIKAHGQSGLLDDVATFVVGICIAIVFAALGLGVMYLASKLTHDDNTMGTQVLLGSVILAVGLANMITDNVGLLTALLMGIGTVRIAPRINRTVAPVLPFFGTIVSIAIGVLFVSISTLVSPESLEPLWLPTLGVVAALVLVVRPAVVFIVTPRGQFTLRERLFMGWMAPRGIVAAATAASVAITLIALKTPGSADLLPVAFMIIVGTVFIYGLTASPVARWLGVKAPPEAPGAGAPAAEPATNAQGG